jgi:hypothetical protein
MDFPGLENPEIFGPDNSGGGGRRAGCGLLLFFVCFIILLSAIAINFDALSEYAHRLLP